MVFTDKQLLKLAGEAAFARGRDYFRDGRVRLLCATEAMFNAEMQGSETYRLELKRVGKSELEWSCECLAADETAVSASTWSRRRSPGANASANR